jgi:hypothetical protein
VMVFRARSFSKQIVECGKSGQAVPGKTRLSRIE